MSVAQTRGQPIIVADIKHFIVIVSVTYILKKVFLILTLIFIFTPDMYIGTKYRLSVYLICNNRYQH